MIDDPWKEELHKYTVGTAKGLGVVVLAVGGTNDHIHLVTRLKASACLSDFMRDLKKATSTWAQTKSGRFAWQEGYAAFTVGRTEKDTIVAYVLNQEEHHRNRTSAEELEQLLREHGIEFDPRFFE